MHPTETPRRSRPDRDFAPATSALDGGQGIQAARRAFRSDIQALRALAIGAVVLNHLWPTRFEGGYVGVDVFFVISGFLITSHLFNEVQRTGTVRLGAFYARRIRRLLPAALLVLAVSAAMVALFLPYPRWLRNAAELAASAAYVENWLLSALSVNYSAASDSASVAQHYWSLSVEEQFYLFWPLAILGALWLGMRIHGRSRPRAHLLLALGFIAAASLTASVVFTATAPAEAYFATYTRAWEFAIGGLIALAGQRLWVPRVAADLLSLAGFAAILVAIFAFDSSTPFPGTSALLPVLGTAAIIAAGTGRRRLMHSAVSATAPVQWLGGISYSLYLWHWPLIVIAPFALGSELSGPVRIGILAAALLLAWGTKRFVEDAGQSWRYWSGSVRRSVACMLAGMAIVIAAAGGLATGQAVRAQADSPTAPVADGPCDGPSALQNVSTCPSAFESPTSAVMTAKNEYFYTAPECGPLLDQLSYGDKRTTMRCDFSQGASNPKRVWLVGDSHAQQWQGAVYEIARKRGWLLTTSYYGGCPVADVAFQGFEAAWGARDAERCRRWSREVSTMIEAEAPDLIFTSMAARYQIVDDGSDRPPLEQFVEGLQTNWRRWVAAGSEVLVLADPPLNGKVRDPDCVLLNQANPVDCARPRSEAQPTDPLVVATQGLEQGGVRLIDLTDRFCDERNCYAVVGSVPVYYNADHLNLEYVRMLADDIDSMVDAEPLTADSG